MGCGRAICSHSHLGTRLEIFIDAATPLSAQYAANYAAMVSRRATAAWYCRCPSRAPLLLIDGVRVDDTMLLMPRGGFTALPTMPNGRRRMAKPWSDEARSIAHRRGSRPGIDSRLASMGGRTIRTDARRGRARGADDTRPGGRFHRTPKILDFARRTDGFGRLPRMRLSRGRFSISAATSALARYAFDARRWGHFAIVYVKRSKPQERMAATWG